jgi:hypothetical protein
VWVCAHACERGARVTRLAQAGVSRRNLFEEVPIVIRNSALVSAFLAEWAETQTTASFEQLEVRDTHTHIERVCVCVRVCVRVCVGSLDVGARMDGAGQHDGSVCM